MRLVQRDDLIARLKKVPGTPRNEWEAKLLAQEGQTYPDGHPIELPLANAVWILVQAFELVPHGCRAESDWTWDPEQYGPALREVFDFLDLPVPEDTDGFMCDVRKRGGPFDPERPGAIPEEEWLAR